jgi:hypothetical protein
MTELVGGNFEYFDALLDDLWSRESRRLIDGTRE